MRGQDNLRRLSGAAESPLGQRLVSIRPCFTQWQRAARHLLAEERAPETVIWKADAGAALWSHRREALPWRVPRRFPDLASHAALFRAEDRWALLYELLWRLTHDEPQLLSLPSDIAVACLQQRVRAVNRDIHKMKTFVRFHRQPRGGREYFVAWYEPEHDVLEPVAAFFKHRFPDVAWRILTPQASAYSEPGSALCFSAGVEKPSLPENKPSTMPSQADRGNVAALNSASRPLPLSFEYRRMPPATQYTCHLVQEPVTVVASPKPPAADADEA